MVECEFVELIETKSAGLKDWRLVKQLYTGMMTFEASPASDASSLVCQISVEQTRQGGVGEELARS